MSAKPNWIGSVLRNLTWRFRFRRNLRKLDVRGEASDFRGDTDVETPVEVAIKTAVGNALEERRQHAEADIRPALEGIDEAHIPEGEFDGIVQDLEGRIEDIHAEARGDLVGTDRERATAQRELDEHVDAVQCRVNELHSPDTSRLTWSALAIVLIEAALGAGVFGDYSPGGMVESFLTGGVIGGANVVCGTMCAWGWQAGWRRFLVKVVATAASAILAGVITLAATHYREALSAGARNVLERALETLWSQPLQPLGSWPLLVLVAFSAFAFLHIVRTWLSIFSRVPGYRKRALRVRRAQEQLARIDTVAKGGLSKATQSAIGEVETKLADGQQARKAVAGFVQTILARVSIFSGERDEIRRLGNEKLAQVAEILSRRSGQPRPTRTIRDDFGLPLAVDDPRPITGTFDAKISKLETARTGIRLVIERLGAAAKDYVTAMSTAIAQGIDIGPDLARRPSGPAPALAGGQD